MSKIIDVEGLPKTFQPSARVVDGVSFAVEEGERRLTSILMRWRSSGGRGRASSQRILDIMGESVRFFEADARTISTFPISQE